MSNMLAKSTLVGKQNTSRLHLGSFQVCFPWARKMFKIIICLLTRRVTSTSLATLFINRSYTRIIDKTMLLTKRLLLSTSNIRCSFS